MGLKSEKNIGRNFWFTVGFIKTTQKMGYNYTKSGITFSGLKAVIIEKHEISRKILTEYLQTLSIEVLSFKTASELVGYLDEHKTQNVFDLILLDRRYQEITDKMELRRLKSLEPLTKAEIILISDSANLYHKEILRETGYSGYLNKPVMLSHLANEIGSLVPAKYKTYAK